MIQLFSLYFKINFKKQLQYRLSAFSGFITQMFFGLFYIYLYIAFFKSNAEPSNFTIVQMCSYIWLQQMFYVMFKYYDGNKELSRQIVRGDVSYQILKPVNLYDQWYMDYYTNALCQALFRAVPLVLVAVFLPGIGLSLPVSPLAFVGFVVTLTLGSVLVVAINMLSYVMVSIVLSPAAVFSMMNLIGSFLAGAFVPIALMPDWFVNIISYTPFRYVSDLPFRIYVGSIGVADFWIYIIIQLFWIALCVLCGRAWLSKRVHKMVVQGG